MDAVFLVKTGRTHVQHAIPKCGVSQVYVQRILPKKQSVTLEQNAC